MRETAAERAAIAHRAIRDAARDVWHQSARAGFDLAVLDFRVRDARAERDDIAFDPACAQCRDAAQIHEHLRLRETQVHHRPERLAAGHELGHALVGRDERDRFVTGERLCVVVGGGLHAVIPLSALACVSRCFASASTIRRGVIGN